MIHENKLDQVGSNDWDASLFEIIISSQKDDKLGVGKGEEAFTIGNRLEKPIITTKGWNIQIRWKEDFLSWIPLSTVKSPNPIELAEYAESNKLSDEPAFKWWAEQTLRKKKRLNLELWSQPLLKKLLLWIVKMVTIFGKRQ